MSKLTRPLSRLTITRSSKFVGFWRSIEHFTTHSSLCLDTCSDLFQKCKFCTPQQFRLKTQRSTEKFDHSSRQLRTLPDSPQDCNSQCELWHLLVAQSSVQGRLTAGCCSAACFAISFCECTMHVKQCSRQWNSVNSSVKAGSLFMQDGAGKADC